ncbi:MAG: phosphate ABC transporter permease PstA [Firmicutes bacterium]|nr:phosphate ABC transporter permease PstA [Bacillota bacterium]
MRTAVLLAEGAAKAMLWFMAAVTFFVLLVIVLYVLGRGLPHLTPGFLLQMPREMGRAGGILPAIVGTFYVTVLALLVAVPVGLGAAVYLAEYTEEGPFTRLLRFGVETLAGVPSIIFGLFGAAVFVYGLRLGLSILAGGLTLALMLLPILIRTAEEAIKAVPGDYREASLALGATKRQTIIRVVIPAAAGGILTGVLLGLGRAVGETAALWLTMGGSILRLPRSLLEQGRTLTLHLYILAMEGLSVERAFATAAFLVLAVFMVNTAALALLARFARRRSGG